MSPADLPQQKLYEVKALPKWPVGCGVMLLGGQVENTLPAIPNTPTEESIPLAQVEWSWSPMNAPVDAYELHKGKEHWLMWCGGPDDNASNYISNRNLRVHDLRHTFATRLRLSGVGIEVRKDLLAHRNLDVTTGYSAGELVELLEAVERLVGSECLQPTEPSKNGKVLQFSYNGVEVSQGRRAKSLI